MVKFADVKKAHTAKGWLVPDMHGRGASPLGLGLNGGGMRHGGSVGGYWQATGAPGGGGGLRDVYGKGQGRDVYPDYGRGYPYHSQVSCIKSGGSDDGWHAVRRNGVLGCAVPRLTSAPSC